LFKTVSFITSRRCLGPLHLELSTRQPKSNSAFWFVGPWQHPANLQPTRTFELVRMDLNAATAGTARWLPPDASACRDGCWCKEPRL